MRHSLSRQGRMPQKRPRFFYRRNPGPGYAVSPAHNQRDDHDGIKIARKAHQHRGVFGYPGFWRDVAVANGENGHIAEVEQVVDGLITRAKTERNPAG